MSQPISEVGAQFISIDCFIDPRNYREGDQGLDDSALQYRIFFIKLILLAILPIVVVVFSWLAWEVVYCIESWRNSRTKTRFEKLMNGSLTSLDRSGVVQVGPKKR